MKELVSFTNRFNQNDSNVPELTSNIESFERAHQIHLPRDFKECLSDYGDLWTPAILDLIVDNDLDLNEVQDFWSIDEITQEKAEGMTSSFEPDLIPFAADSMGNSFCFRTDELQVDSAEPHIYYFDQEFDRVKLVSNSFLEWIMIYLEIKA